MLSIVEQKEVLSGEPHNPDLRGSFFFVVLFFFNEKSLRWMGTRSPKNYLCSKKEQKLIIRSPGITK